MMATPLSGDAQAKRFCAAAVGFSRNRDITAAVLVAFGNVSRLMRIENGKVAAIDEKLPPLSSWDFAMHGTPEAWEALWEHPFPKPGRHDILALAKLGEMRLEGRLEILMRHLQYFKDLLNCPRKEATS